MLTKARELTVGALAKTAGVNLETVRYYERIGLMPLPRRSGGGHRVYDDQAARHLKFVRRARELGFSIADIKALLNLATPGQVSCNDVRELAGAHLDNVRTKLRDLAKIETVLASTIAECGENGSPRCPVIDVLDPPSENILEAALTIPPSRKFPA